MGHTTVLRVFATVILIISVLVVPRAATADTGPGPASGTWTQAIGPVGSYGYAFWDATNATGSQEFITLRAYGSGLSAGNCVTAWFDWGLTPIEHYDARAVRDCSPAGQEVFQAYSDIHGPIRGMQKLAVCHGVNDNLGSCIEHPQRTSGIGGVNPSFTTFNCTTRWARRNADATFSSFNGGDPLAPTC